MSEGEFKRRIKEGTSISGFLWIADWYRIEKCINDVHKEFLKFEQFELPQKPDGSIDWEKACNIMEQRNIKRERWFLKWFGE